MRNYLILILIFTSFIAFAYSGLFEYDLLGGTELNGSGCVCHTTDRDTSVSVWIEGPDTLIAGQTGFYKMFLANGPAEAGGYNVAGRFGTMSLVDTFSFWSPLSPNELTQSFPLVFPTPQDTIYWEFAYTVPDSTLIDTLYSCGLSLVYDSIPDFHDRWNFGPKFQITVIEDIVPVELVSFTYSVNKNSVVLNWITSTEINNSGFEVQRKIKDSNIKKFEWGRVVFIAGNGTTTEKQVYSYNDANLISAHYQYRLKQINFDGSFEFSKIIEATFDSSPIIFVLEQNYPNPFNPSTKISWQSSISGNQNLKVYDVLGNEVLTLVNEYRQAGNYAEEFDLSMLNNRAKLTSGIYFYRLQIGDYVETKKMVLLK